MRIIVAGLAATYPLGGVFWDYFQYVQGLADLGHDVLYLEDVGAWCYDPPARTFVETGERSAAWLDTQCRQSLPEQRTNWMFRDARGTVYGSDANYVLDRCRTAELFLNISGPANPCPDTFPRARTVYIDTDPMYGQEYVATSGSLSPEQRLRLEIMKAHDVHLTYGENVGQPDCSMPTHVFPWKPTRQPVLVDRMSAYRIAPTARIRHLTTVGSWEDRPLTIDGKRYYGKRREFVHYRHLPAASPLPFTLAMSGRPPDLSDAPNWNIIDPAPVSASAEDYLRFLASSFAEWSIAKHAYVASRSGWFSRRTALYLALGVPAIVQDTGFSRFLPVGTGLLAFSTPDEALASIESVLTDYPRHCRSAAEIAHVHFDAKRVLSKLIEDVFSIPEPASAQSPAPLP